MSDLHALLVGIDRYRPQRLPGGGKVSDLQACTNDVERMEAFLRAEPVALPPERIRKLVSPPSGPYRREPAAEDLPTLGNIVRELGALCELAGEGDRVLIHYSGHGASLPTAVPQKKGPWGRDEALVPCDAGEGEGRFLRDVEIYEILQRLAAKKVQTTLVLDCCHAGGITRDLTDGNVRGLGEVAAPVPAASLLGSWEELAAAYPTAEEAGGGSGSAGQEPGRPAASVTRHVFHTAGWFPQPEGCVLLAACRPTELAREYAFDGGGWSGALTHFLLESAGDLGCRPTYRWLHHRLLGRIRGLFDTQTPLLEGDGDLLFLGRESWPARRGIAVLAVEGEGAERKVQIAAGRAQGLGKGARLGLLGRDGHGEGGIEGAGTKEPGAEGPAGEGERGSNAELEVYEPGATTSWARVVGEGSAEAPVEPGDLAAVADPGQGATRYPVRVRRWEGGGDRAAGGGGSHAEALERLEEALAGGTEPLLCLGERTASQRVQEAGPRRESDPSPSAAASASAGPAFQVEVTPNGSFQVLDPTGEPIPHQGKAIPAAEPDAVERILDRLVHLARYKERERLDNPRSPLAGELRAELFRIECIESWQDPEARGRIPEGATVKEGTLLCLLVRNDSNRDLSFAVLDLQPDWGITQVHPGPGEGHYTVLHPKAEHPVFLRAGLPEWMEEGRDRLKVIATTGPLDATSLELQPLGASTGCRSLRGRQTSGEPQDLREQLFNTSRSGYRNTAALTSASHQWVVETMELAVSRLAAASNLSAAL